MLIARQITWMIYLHVNVSEKDGAMLDWDEPISVELKCDNLQQFSSDWESTILAINDLPNEKFLRSMYHKQLETVINLKIPLAFIGKISLKEVRGNPTNC